MAHRENIDSLILIREKSGQASHSSSLSKARRLAGLPGEDRAAKVGENYLDDARWDSVSILAVWVDNALMASGIGSGELRGALRTADEALFRRALGLQIVAATILICLKNRDVREVKTSHCFNFKAACEQLQNYAASAIPKAHKTKMRAAAAAAAAAGQPTGQAVAQATLPPRTEPREVSPASRAYLHS